VPADVRFGRRTNNINVDAKMTSDLKVGVDTMPFWGLRTSAIKLGTDASSSGVRLSACA
jgi:hypothetical protein